MAKRPVQTFVDARGRSLLERRGLPRELGSTLANDAYHFLRTATWTRIALLFAAVFVGTNIVFAAILWAGHARVTNATGFLDYFWFSVQTLATIGYGTLSPDDTLSHVVVTIESFFGLVLTALVTGVFFARFSTTTARVVFSNVAIVGDHEGKPHLMFRMANARSTAIVEATVRVYMTRDEVLASGEKLRRVYDLPLRRNVTPIFAWSWTAYHLLDEASPLHGLAAANVMTGAMNIIITLQGIDDRLAATVHTRWAYNPGDLRFGQRFVDILKYDADTNVRYLDFTNFHDTEPVRTALTSVEDQAAPG